MTLKLVAEYDDACNISGDLTTIKHKLMVLKQHCEIIGRDYNSIYRTAGTIGMIADIDEEALANIPAKVKAILGTMVKSMLIGSPETIRQRLAEYEAIGVQELVIRFPDPVHLFEIYQEIPEQQLNVNVPHPLQINSILRFAKEFIT